MANIAVLSYYSGVVDRGVETFVSEMCKRLKKKHSITIYQSGAVHYEAGIKVYRTGPSAKTPKSAKGIIGKFYFDIQSLKILVFSIKLIPIIIKGKYDVIILLNGGWQTLIYRLVSKISLSQLLISGHAGIGSDDAINIFFRPNVFVALTSPQFAWAQKIAPEMKIKLIPNGVDLAMFNPKVKPIQLSLKEPIVICASALVQYKRVDLTIRAVAHTKYLSLLLLGDGELQGYLDSLGKRLLGSRYMRINPQYYQMPRYYRAGSIFTLASETEAFGISYIEAMACNLPVVTNNDPSRQEIIGNAGILTDPHDMNQYARDLMIASKTNYRNIPYDQALKFSWNKIAGKYSKLIRELVGKT